MNWRWTAVLVCMAMAASNSQAYSGTVPGLPENQTVAPPFSVKVELTPRAASELERRGETIVVAAYFYGLANSLGAKYSDETGQISWSEEDRMELDRPGIAKFGSRNLNLSLLDYFVDRKPIVLLNVFSGRRTEENNLLSCGIFEDSVYIAAKNDTPITCDLIR